MLFLRIIPSSCAGLGERWHCRLGHGKSLPRATRTRPGGSACGTRTCMTCKPATKEDNMDWATLPGLPRGRRPHRSDGDYEHSMPDGDAHGCGRYRAAQANAPPEGGHIKPPALRGCLMCAGHVHALGGCKSLCQPDGGVGRLAKHKGVIVRWGLKAVCSKGVSRRTETGYEASRSDE